MRFSGFGILGRAFEAKSHSNAQEGHKIIDGGDLLHMARQEEVLRKAGFKTGRWDVYPTVHEKDYVNALTYLYTNRIEGWWNLETDLVAEKICTQAEYDKALGRK